MAFRELEIDFEGMAFYEIEVRLAVRDGELQRIEIESARQIPEDPQAPERATEVELTPTVRALLDAEVRRYFDDPESLRELEQEDIDAARDAATDAAIDAAREDRDE
jgi:hypothetical protein